jgi:outer membrane protein TolC
MHPELRRLEAELRAGQTRIDLAEKRFYPDIRVMAGYNSLWDETQKQWTIGASINIPFSRDKYQAGLVAARAKAMQTRWQLQDRRNYLLANLEQTRAEVEESVRVIRLYRDKLVPLAEENLSATLADYQAGLGDFLNVITAEDEKLKTELSLEQYYAGYLQRLAALEQWSGASATDY